MDQQQSSDSTINRVVQLLQSSVLKQKNLSDKVSDAEVSRLIDDTVKLSRSKRSKKGRKGSNKQHVRNKWNTKKNREKAREIVGEAVDYFDGYKDQLIYNRTSQGTITRGSQTAMSLEQLNLELINSVKQSNLNKVKEYINEGADISTKDNHGKTPLHIAAKRGLLDIAKFLLDKGADIDAQENKFGRAPLHLAAAKGHLDIVKYLIEKGADVDVYQGGWSYSTALHLTARKGHLDIVKYLIEKGANPKATDGGGKTPLQRATQKGHSDIVEYLKGKVPQITERQQVATEVPHTTERRQVTTEIPQTTEASQITTEVLKTIEDYSHTTLHLAAEQGNLNAVKYFVEKGIDINSKNERGETPLHLAAEKSNLDLVKYLVEKGANINAKDGDGDTPLHRAASSNYLDIARFLIESGANVNTKNKSNDTPLSISTEWNKPEMAELLLSKGANVNIIVSNGFTPMGHAVISPFGYSEEDRINMLKTLLNHRKDAVDIKDSSGITALYIATAHSKLDIIKLLLDNGANINIRRDRYGDTPLHWAASYRQLPAVKLLIERGGDVNARNRDREIPLHKALTNSLQGVDLDIIRYLVQKGSNINAKENHDFTPIHYAAANGYLNAMELLIQNGADTTIKNINGKTSLDLVKTEDRPQVAEFLSSYQRRSRSRRDISSNSWMNDSIVNWVKGFLPSTKSPDLLTSREHSSTAATAIPEINTTVVNNTLLLGILAAGLFNKTRYKQPIHESLLSPREQSMRLNNVDEEMIIRAIQKGEEKVWGDPKTEMDEVKISGNKTGMWRGFL